ncbi:MAG: hypothetical protein ABEK16_03405 [Candidatus Nanohalobium sp.]
MPYRYRCSLCEREFRADTRREAVHRAQQHFDRQHDGSLDEEKARERIIQE